MNLAAIILQLWRITVEPWRIDQVEAASIKHGVAVELIAAVCMVESAFGHPRMGRSLYWCGAVRGSPYSQPYGAASALQRGLTICGTVDRALLFYLNGRCVGADPEGYVPRTLGALWRIGRER